MSDTIQETDQRTQADPTAGPLRSQPTSLDRTSSPRTESRPNPSNGSISKWLIRSGILGGIIAIGYLLLPLFQSADETEKLTLTHTLKLRTITDTVIEHGTLESQSVVEGICRLHGWENRITYIVEEGAHVQEGDVVVRFDNSRIVEDLAEEQILLTKVKASVDEAEQQLAVQKNENESAIAAAELKMQLAELDLEKYLEGDYKAELAELDRSIAESKAILAQKRDMAESLRVLVKKGFREPEQLRQMEQEVTSAQFQLDRDEQKKEVLEKFDYKRKITELQSNAEEAVRELARAETTAQSNLAKAEYRLEAARKEFRLQEEEVKEEEEQLEHCEIKASQAGTVAYANHRYIDPQYRVRPGGSIHRRQTVFHLPDMSRMQVRLEIHESLINKIVEGQQAKIKVESYPDVELSGAIDRIADLARSDGDSEEQKYTATILIDSFPKQVKLKPGMTARTEIMIRTMENVVAIPVQAVTEHLNQEYAFVVTEKGLERRAIDTSAGNESFLIVESGLEVGEQVALDAYQRGLEDFGSLSEQEQLELNENSTDQPNNKKPNSKDESAIEPETIESSSAENETDDEVVTEQEPENGSEVGQNSEGSLAD